jgi:hypothetical protein
MALKCPWREPDQDLRLFFPGRTHYKSEKRILSAYISDLRERLGHTPGGDETLFPVHRVYSNNVPAGFIITRRVHGEYGLIELVLAVTESGEIVAVRVQRQREPAAIARAICEAKWLDAFRRKTLAGPFAVGQDLPAVPAEAKTSAQTIADGVRHALILLDVSHQPQAVIHSH